MATKTKTILGSPALTGEYNYSFVYDCGNTRYFKTNDYSIPLDRALDEIRELLLGVDEVNGAVIKIELKAVSI